MSLSYTDLIYFCLFIYLFYHSVLYSLEKAFEKSLGPKLR